MSDLKPCPFCGSKVYMWLYPVEECYSVMCSTCSYETYRYTTEAEAIAAWDSRAERTCECIMCAYFENKSTCGAYCNYFDRELGDDYDGGCTWGVLSGCKVVDE